MGTVVKGGDRILARSLAKELTEDELKSISGGDGTNPCGPGGNGESGLCTVSHTDVALNGDDTVVQDIQV